MSVHPPQHDPDIRRRAWRDGLITGALFALALTFYLAHLGDLPLMKPDEIRNAEVGREMLVSGSWIVPTFNGLPYLDKPAFFFKSVALSFAAFGVTEGAARLPSALSAWALLLATFAFGRRAYGLGAARLAVIVVATMPLFLAFGRLVIMDMMFALCVSLAIFAGYQAEERAGRRRLLWHAAGAAAAGVATLVKGPLGFVLPWLVLGVFFLVDRRPRALLRLFGPLNWLVLFGIVLPWFILLSRHHPDFPRYGLVEESFNRLTSGVFRRRKPFYFYAPVLFGTCFPWSLLALGALAAAWRARGRWLRADRMLVVWFVVVVVLFSLPRSKQPAYVLSALVPLGLLVARVAMAALADPAGCAARGLRGAAAALAVFCLLCAAGLGTVPLAPDWVAGALKTPAASVAAMVPHLALWAAVCGALGVLAGVGAWRRSGRLALLAFAACLPLMGLVGVYGFEAYAGVRSQRSVADSIPVLPAGAGLVSVQCFPVYVPFYRSEPMWVATENGREIPSNYIPYALQRSAAWPDRVVRLRDFDRWVARRQAPLYVISRGEARARVERLAAEQGRAVDELTHGYCGVLLDAPGGS